MSGSTLTKPPAPPFSTAAKAAAKAPAPAPAPAPSNAPAAANVPLPEQPKSNFMMYAIIGFVIFLVIVAVACYFMFFKSKKSDDEGSETVYRGKSNIIRDETIEIDNYRMTSNPDTSSVEITKKGNDTPVWTSNTPGASEVAWLIGTDGIFRVYHMKDDDDTWRSVKAANVIDTAKLKGPYTYQFKNGIFSVLNVNKDDVWNTGSGQLVVDTSKTIDPTVRTSYEVRNTNADNVSITLSDEYEYEDEDEM